MNFLSYLINGISLGSVYAIIALGYTMVTECRPARTNRALSSDIEKSHNRIRLLHGLDRQSDEIDRDF